MSKLTRVYTLIGGVPNSNTNDIELQLIDRAAYDKLEDERDKAVYGLKKLKAVLSKPGADVVEENLQLQDTMATLKAQLYVAKDSALRTYDGLAQKADERDNAVADLRFAINILKGLGSDAPGEVREALLTLAVRWPNEF